MIVLNKCAMDWLFAILRGITECAHGASMHLIFSDAMSEDIVSDIVARDAALWLADTSPLLGEDVEAIAKLVANPWRAIFIESTSAVLADTLAAMDSSIPVSSLIAFSHVIASDPSTLVLQQRARPIFFLNGIDGRAGKESSSLTGNSALKRRLNMLSKLSDLEPRRVIVAGNSPLFAIKDIADLWESEFRAMLTVVSSDQSEVPEVTELLEKATSLQSLGWIKKDFGEFSGALSTRLSKIADLSKIIVSSKLANGKSLEIDLSLAEHLEQPLSESCEFISVRDTLNVSPQDLKNEELQAFFTRDDSGWRAYAAGLPWTPDLSVEKKFLRNINEQLTGPDGTLQLFSIVSEPGAGGTTRARSLAFAAAKAGVPVLIVKQHADVPSELELTNFLFRAVSLIEDEYRKEQEGPVGEPVWLIVLDVQHGGRGFDEMERFCAELLRSGRKVSILKVVSTSDSLSAPSVDVEELIYVSHNLEAADVANLGSHLNGYLKHFKRAKSSDEWVRFWEAHRPDIDTGFASFWIALEFWLAGYLELGESIQGWALRQFKSLEISAQIKRTILEIAALSIERRATPERLMGDLKSPLLPWSIALEDCRWQSPGLGLVQSSSSPYGRVWAIGHDILGRYLINGVWNDRLLREELDLSNAVDPVDLRLTLISDVVQRPSMGEPFAQEFVKQLATHILKLEERQGNAEFFPHWRKVLAILDAVPASVRVGSRAFNHHTAISRRRVTQDELFQISDTEKRSLLNKAVLELEFALNQIDYVSGDETDINLLNTLALVFQDLAELERNGVGDRALMLDYLAKADEITNRALRENPNNRYVLETAAKNLLRQRHQAADGYPKVEAAAKALTFVFQASRLESGPLRRMSLGSLAAEALGTLRDPSAYSIIENMCAQNNPFGFLAKAWCCLPLDSKNNVSFVIDDIDETTANTALSILKLSPVRDWLLIRLQYDLEVIANPRDFQSQLNLLDELATTSGYRMSLQQLLDRAVLLYLQGQHKAAGREFQQLRPKIKESQMPVFVAQRLKWLLTPDKNSRAICSARVADSHSTSRILAKVRELGNAEVLFIAQEFSKARMGAGEQFKCQVTFSAMGPFLKPVDASH
jgi:hypothetical protein